MPMSSGERLLIIRCILISGTLRWELTVDEGRTMLPLGLQARVGKLTMCVTLNRAGCIPAAQ